MLNCSVFLLLAVALSTVLPMIEAVRKEPFIWENQKAEYSLIFVLTMFGGYVITMGIWLNKALTDELTRMSSNHTVPEAPQLPFEQEV